MNRPTMSLHRPPRRQRGATLVIALLVLVLIMMIGITAVSTSDTQFKLAGNLQFEDSALNNAEVAVTTAENWLGTGTNYTDAGFTVADPAKPQLLPRAAPRPTSRDTDPLTVAWADTNSLAVGGNTNQRYRIELMSLNNRLPGSSQVVGGRATTGCNQVNTYLITGRGVSARGATKLIQSYFSVLSCT
jgi:Tfp pilus assembly protein PilX